MGRALIILRAGGALTVHAHVTTQTLRMIGAAKTGQSAAQRTGIARDPVKQSVVTLFHGFNNAVAAHLSPGNLDGLLPLAATVAAVPVKMVVIARPTDGRIGRVTFLLWRFDDAVAAVFQALPLATHGAIVVVHQIAVIAFLARIEKTVAATGRQPLLPLAERGTSVPVEQVAVVALFPLLRDAVAAESISFRLLRAADRVASVTIQQIAIVTCFARIEEAIPAGRVRLAEAADTPVP